MNFTSADFWFTQKGGAVYVIAFAYPTGDIFIQSLRQEVEAVKSVKLLGYDGELRWTQGTDGLTVEFPSVQINPLGYVLYCHT